MKKILLVMMAVLCVASVSAQGKFKDAVNTVTSQKWSVGLRATYGVQVAAECFYSDKAYLEGRLGIFNGATADFTVLHNWNCCNWDWTPSVGKWYLDAGVGGNIGGNAHCCYGGIVGQAKFGIKFNKVPIRLAIDYSPAINIVGVYGGKAALYTAGFYNGGLSATWCF